MAYVYKGDRVLDDAQNGVESDGAVIDRVPPGTLHQPDYQIYQLAQYPTKVFVRAFEIFFSKFDRWHFSQDDKQTGIYVRSAYPKLGKGAAETDMKPGVIVQRTGELTRAKRDGRSMFRRWYLAKNKDRILVFKDDLITTITIHCVSKEGIEAEQLAGAVFAVLNVDEECFKQTYKMHAVLPPAIMPEGILITEEEQELVDVPVVFQVEYTWAFARTSDGQVFEDLEVSVEDGVP